MITKTTNDNPVMLVSIFKPFEQFINGASNISAGLVTAPQFIAAYLRSSTPQAPMALSLHFASG